MGDSPVGITVLYPARHGECYLSNDRRGGVQVGELGADDGQGGVIEGLLSPSAISSNQMIYIGFRA